MSKKFVYFFSDGFTEGKKELKKLLGGKGANLAEMCLLDLPIPPGFTITTEVCEYYHNHNHQYPKGLKEQVEEKIDRLEKLMGKNFGDPDDPLLVSIRSGAKVSMPGMMDSILNLGLNDKSVKGLASHSGNEKFAYDSYRRLIQMFGDVALGVEHDKFEDVIEEQKSKKGIYSDFDLNLEDWIQIVSRNKDLIKEEKEVEFPQNPRTQLWMAIDAVLKSWNNKRAVSYRKLENITGLMGTAVNIQVMVFGNMGENSGTGVAFTRNAATGKNEFFAEYLMNAQGEDVVAGIRTPNHIKELAKENPKIYNQLLAFKVVLEKHFRDMQDMEFTIQEGKLYLLQTRTGKRTTSAAIKIALDMVREKLISKREAIMRISPKQLDQLLHPTIDPKEKYNAIGKGIPASPGAAVGKIVFTAHKAEKLTANGEKVVLVRKETSPEDINGMAIAQGILTATGGLTSHAAVVARGMGKCCVSGCGDLVIKSESACEISGKTYHEGDFITLNGTTGEVIDGQLKLITPKVSGDFQDFMSWVDSEMSIKVRTNADTPKDSSIARNFGAEGIGLCRTEHMFFEGDRIDAVREMILADTVDGRKNALNKILPMQMNDFVEIFTAMDGFPVTIRLLDPPLHEFLPHSESELKNLAEVMGIGYGILKRKTESLKEFNPMLGLRGCRLAILYPEIAEIQSEAIFKAALTVSKKGIKVFPEIMIPFIGSEKEFIFLKNVIDTAAKKIFQKQNLKVKYKIGTMIEIPRACLVADKIAEHAMFFSFGTNDLTQMTFGYSRDDAGVFMLEYLKKKILPSDPFQILDREGIGELVKLGIKKGRKSNPDLKVGICGEHGGEPSSVEFCVNEGIDYVSCSPYRVPIARLAAAQAKIKNKMNIREG